MQVTVAINITSFVARQKVNVLLLDKVGTGLLSEIPALVAADWKQVFLVRVAWGTTPIIALALNRLWASSVRQRSMAGLSLPPP